MCELTLLFNLSGQQCRSLSSLRSCYRWTSGLCQRNRQQHRVPLGHQLRTRYIKIYILSTTYREHSFTHQARCHLHQLQDKPSKHTCQPSLFCNLLIPGPTTNQQQHQPFLFYSKWSKNSSHHQHLHYHWHVTKHKVFNWDQNLHHYHHRDSNTHNHNEAEALGKRCHPALLPPFCIQTYRRHLRTPKQLQLQTSLTGFFPSNLRLTRRIFMKSLQFWQKVDWHHKICNTVCSYTLNHKKVNIWNHAILLWFYSKLSTQNSHLWPADEIDYSFLVTQQGKKMPCLFNERKIRESIKDNPRSQAFCCQGNEVYSAEPNMWGEDFEELPGIARTVAKTTALAKHQTSFVIVGLAWGSLQKNCSGGIRTTLDLATFGGALDAQGDQGHVHDLASKFPGDVVRDHNNKCYCCHTKRHCILGIAFPVTFGRFLKWSNCTAL